MAMKSLGNIRQFFGGISKLGDFLNFGGGMSIIKIPPETVLSAILTKISSIYWRKGNGFFFNKFHGYDFE